MILKCVPVGWGLIGSYIEGSKNFLILQCIRY